MNYDLTFRGFLVYRISEFIQIHDNFLEKQLIFRSFLVHFDAGALE